MSLLEVKNLGISFGGLRAVDGFHISIEKGQLYGLIGPNGAGKTTVFNMLTGVYTPNDGSITLDGVDITGKKTIDINKAGIARTFQNIRLFKDQSVLDNVKIGLHNQITYSTLAGYGAVGAGVPPYEIKKIVTVCKAYSSAVGAGAFVSEIFGDEADELRRRGGDGGEFGATTGRPRRMGWLDCVASRYGCRMQGTTDVAFTVLDVLGYLDEIPVCVAYEVDGKEIHDFPNTSILEKAKPVLKTLPGWKCDIRGIKKYEDLPENCRKYIEFIEKQIECPITMISNGPGRDDIIYRNK